MKTISTTDNWFCQWAPLRKSANPEVKGGIRTAPAHATSAELGGIAGVMSTSNRDQEDEVITQSGLDFTYFLKKGVFNYEHQQGPDNTLGYPTSVECTDEETLVEGYLYLGIPEAKATYIAMEAMEKSGGERSVGLSIEGQILERDKDDPRIVLKARVLNCAITQHPMNVDARVGRLESIAKSMGFVPEPTLPVPDIDVAAIVAHYAELTFRKKLGNMFPDTNTTQMSQLLKEISSIGPKTAFCGEK